MSAGPSTGLGNLEYARGDECQSRNRTRQDPLELAVEEAIALCDGDVYSVLRAALVANSFLTAEVEWLAQAASFGFTRGRSAARPVSEKLDDWAEISSGEQETT